jgi:hypothetical protein
LKSVFVFALLLGSAVTGPAADRRSIAIGQSHVLIRVYKAGLFSAFAHNHQIEAPIAAGSVELSEPRSVSLRFESDRLKVLDPEVSPATRADIQRTMLGPKVLDAVRYAEIRFQSRRVEETGADRWRVEGELTLHGKTRPVTMEVVEAGGVYRGAAKLRQSDFGIQPIRIAGGTVRVKDELRIEFAIRLGDSAGRSRDAGTKLHREGGPRP